VTRHKDQQEFAEEMLRFNGSVKHDPAIDVWLSKQTEELGSIARMWFARIRKCGKDVSELMHDGCATACIGDVPFAYVGVFKAHVNIGFYLGSTLPDPKRLLLGTGKRMRHVKLKPGEKVDSAALSDLIDAAYFAVNSRL
jgi:hypothetical protein